MGNVNCLHLRKDISCFIQLDYKLISNSFQEFLTMTEILTPVSTNHSLVLFPLSKGKSKSRGKGFRKFNTSLTKDQNIRNFYTKNESLVNCKLK